MIFNASASVNVSLAPGAVFASRKNFFTFLSVSRATLSFAFIAAIKIVCLRNPALAPASTVRYTAKEKLRSLGAHIERVRMDVG